MTISIIVAVAENGVIGNGNDIPWYIPEDFKFFKAKTMGKPCIMGRKTYESILSKLGKPLPGRTSIVVSRSLPPSPPPASGGGGDEVPRGGVITQPSLKEAIAAAQKENPEEIMIIGGAQIYAQALEENLVDTIYLTRVHQSPDGDAFFPALSDDEWKETSREDHDGFSFIISKRSNNCIDHVFNKHDEINIDYIREKKWFIYIDDDNSIFDEYAEQLSSAMQLYGEYFVCFCREHAKKFVKLSASKENIEKLQDMHSDISTEFESNFGILPPLWGMVFMSENADYLVLRPSCARFCIYVGPYNFIKAINPKVNRSFEVFVNGKPEYDIDKNWNVHFFDL